MRGAPRWALCCQHQGKGAPTWGSHISRGRFLGHLLDAPAHSKERKLATPLKVFSQAHLWHVGTRPGSPAQPCSCRHLHHRLAWTVPAWVTCGARQQRDTWPGPEGSWPGSCLAARGTGQRQEEGPGTCSVLMPDVVAAILDLGTRRGSQYVDFTDIRDLSLGRSYFINFSD